LAKRQRPIQRQHGLGPEGVPGPFRSAPAATDAEVELGFVSGVFGVHGEVRLHLHHRGSTLLEEGHAVVLVDPAGGRWAARLQSRSGAGKRVLGRFDERLSREQALALKDWRIQVPVAALPALDDGEFWVWQLQGAPVRVDGEVIGEVVEVHAAGPVDVFEVKLHGEKEHAFVPALQEHVASAGPDGLDLLERP